MYLLQYTYNLRKLKSVVQNPFTINAHTIIFHYFAESVSIILQSEPSIFDMGIRSLTKYISTIVEAIVHEKSGINNSPSSQLQEVFQMQEQWKRYIKTTTIYFI